MTLAKKSIPGPMCLATETGDLPHLRVVNSIRDPAEGSGGIRHRRR